MAEEEATSKRVEPAQGTKPGLKIKRPAGRQPMSKARASTVKPAPIEPIAVEGKKRKERVKKTVARVLGKASITEDEEEEEEVAAPAPKAAKLMGDAIRSGTAASKPKDAPKAASKPKSAPKRNTRSIPAAEKNKSPVPEAIEEEEESVLRKLRPKIPDHNDAHPVAEDMKLRRDSGLRKWR